MPLYKKHRNKIRSRIVFWLTVAAILALMVYIPKKPDAGAAPFIEYELH